MAKNQKNKPVKTKWNLIADELFFKQWASGIVLLVTVLTAGGLGATARRSPRRMRMRFFFGKQQGFLFYQ